MEEGVRSQRRCDNGSRDWSEVIASFEVKGHEPRDAAASRCWRRQRNRFFPEPPEGPQPW